MITSHQHRNTTFKQLNKCGIINELLLDDEDLTAPGHNKSRWAFFIHSSVELSKFKMVLNIQFEKEVYDYKLQIAGKIYDMQLVIVDLSEVEIKRANFIRNFIAISQFCFPWQHQLQLFINVANYHILESFIKEQNLTSFILKIEENSGLNSDDETIKVVTFNKSAKKFELIKKYQNHMRQTQTVWPTHYYATMAFRWLQPDSSELCTIRKEFSQMHSSTFPIILDHLSTIGQLHIYELLSLRLAFCDFRNSHRCAILQCEIDYFIGRELKKIIQYGHFDIEEYAYEKNIVIPDPFLTPYLLYEFQNAYETVVMTRITKHVGGFFGGIRSFWALRKSIVIKLAQENDQKIKTIRKKWNASLIVDGTNFDGMNVPLFLDLFECDHVHKIILDTDISLSDAESESLDRTQHPIRKERCSVHLIGTNRLYCIEQFVASLKMAKFANDKLDLHVNHPLVDYTIFDAMSMYSITFWENIKIDKRMLQELNKCDMAETLINFNGCSIEGTHENWQLLVNLKNRNHHSKIREDESTWDSFFDFIINVLNSISTMEYEPQITGIGIIILTSLEPVDLSKLTFRIDRLNSKLNITDAKKEIVELYYLKNNIPLGNRDDFNFYQ